MTTQTTKLSGTFSATPISNSGFVQRLLRAIKPATTAAPCSPNLSYDRGDLDSRPAPEESYRPLAYSATFEAMKMRSL